MIKLLTVIGARPQIIKAAALSRAVRSGSDACGVRFDERVTERILHTGQHYDDNMSGSFFRELGIPEPDYNLQVGSATHGVQTARMIEGLESVLQQEHFDGVVLYGDTNSTLAGAVAASKLHVPVFHIEAGLRSFNMTMPEEINRIVCDRLSSILFAPTLTAMNNLRQEGLTDSPACFVNGRRRKVVQSGDVMYDNSMYFATLAAKHSSILKDLHLQKKKFILSTIHRDSNTDNPQRLNAIFQALLTVAEQHKQPIVLPLHPRTHKMLPRSLSADLLKKVTDCPLICLADPAGFLDMIELERNASLVLTDSGGVQKEAFFFETPCVILRPETEWVEIVEAEAGMLADADEEKIVTATAQLMEHQVHFPPLFGDAHAAEKILTEIINYLSI